MHVLNDRRSLERARHLTSMINEKLVLYKFMHAARELATALATSLDRDRRTGKRDVSFFTDNSSKMFQICRNQTLTFAERLQRGKGKIFKLVRWRIRDDIQVGRLPKPRELTQRDLLFQHMVEFFDRSWVAVYSLGRLPPRRIPVRGEGRTGTRAQSNRTTALCVGACTG